MYSYYILILLKNLPSGIYSHPPMVGCLGRYPSIQGSRVQIPGQIVAADIIYWIPANDELITELGKCSKRESI